MNCGLSSKLYNFIFNYFNDIIKIDKFLLITYSHIFQLIFFYKINIKTVFEFKVIRYTISYHKIFTT